MLFGTWKPAVSSACINEAVDWNNQKTGSKIRLLGSLVALCHLQCGGFSFLVRKTGMLIYPTWLLGTLIRTREVFRSLPVTCFICNKCSLLSSQLKHNRKWSQFPKSLFVKTKRNHKMKRNRLFFCQNEKEGEKYEQILKSCYTLK